LFHRFTGEATCYPWAFGLPALLMIIALALFLFGSSKYKRLPPSGSVVPTIVKGTSATRPATRHKLIIYSL
jgi:dipeptide/tripeptide permease